MLKLLAKLYLFGQGPLVAPLAGVNGFTGRGAIGYAGRNGRSKRMRVFMRGVAGRNADIFADGALAASTKVKNGRVWAHFASERGDPVPALEEGAVIEIRQNGDVILSGVLSRK
ncbi:MAG: hypothetical protein R3C58_15930 [Parvularculaceae bacterium]